MPSSNQIISAQTNEVGSKLRKKYSKLLINSVQIERVQEAYVKVMLGENMQKPTIIVPANVVIPDSRSKQITIVQGGIAKLIDVETGYRTTSSVEITKGLKVGDSIIVSGMLFVRQGSNVKISKTVKLADITK